MNIAVVRFSSLGDLITLELSFRAIRYFFKDASITLITSEIGRALYDDSKYFDIIEVFDGKSYYKFWNKHRGITFDIVINMQCTRPSHLLLLGLKNRKKINSGSSFLQRLVGLKVKSIWIPEILELCGVDKKEIQNYFELKKSNIISLPYQPNDKAAKLLEQLPENNLKIVIAPGASERWGSKRWDDDSYSKLACLFINLGFEVILIGTNSDAEIGKNIQNNCIGVTNLIGKTSLSELKYILSLAKLLVGNDSGPAHLAAAVGTNTATIFGPTDPRHGASSLYYNGLHLHIVSNPKIHCQPCYKTKCPTKHECMVSLSVEDIFESIKRQGLLS